MLEILMTLVVFFGASAASGDEPRPAVPSSWERIESADLRFRVWMPPEPVRTRDTRRTWAGTVDEFMLRAEVPGGEFVIQVRELPRATPWLVTEKYLLSVVKDGFLKNGERPEISDEPITRAGYSGRRLRYRDPGRGDGEWIEDALILLAENRLYFVVVGREVVAPIPDRAMEEFFRSFELW